MTVPISRSRHTALVAASIGAGLVVWAGAARVTGAPDVLPSPDVVFSAFVDMLRSGELVAAVKASASRVFAGYAIGTLVGIVAGLLLGSSRFASDSLGPVFDFLKGIPPIALVPMVIIWLGIGEISKYVVIAYIVGVVVAISTAVAAREVPLVRLRTGAFLGLSRFEVFRRILLPSCRHGILSGMRSAIGFAFVALVSAELIAANSGLGQVIMESRFALQTPRMIVGLLVLGALGATVQWLFDLAVGRWRAAART